MSHTKLNRNVIVGMVALVTICLASSAFGQAEGMDKVDDILERLDRQILDDQAGSVEFAPRRTTPDAVETFESEQVEASTRRLDALGELEEALKGLELEVDRLGANVQRTKQNILDQAGVDNFVQVAAELNQSEHAAVKSLSVKVDGYQVYSLDEAAGLWLPSKSIPVYAGPLRPGSHQIDVEARIVLRHKNGLPLNSAVYRFVNKSFSVTIPGGTVNRRFVIALTPPKDVAGQVKAELKTL